MLILSSKIANELPELGSGGSGDGGLYFLEFLLDTIGLLLLSDSTVLWRTVLTEFCCMHGNRTYMAMDDSMEYAVEGDVIMMLKHNFDGIP